MPNIPPKPDTDDKPFLTLAEAAALGSLSVSALRKRCQRGEAGFKVGKTWILSREEAYKTKDTAPQVDRSARLQAVMTRPNNSAAFHSQGIFNQYRKRPENELFPIQKNHIPKIHA